MDRAARHHRREAKASRQRTRKSKGNKSPANRAPDDSHQSTLRIFREPGSLFR